MEQDRIICAAIHVLDGKEHIHEPTNIRTGFVVAGRRHHNCFSTMAILGYKYKEDAYEIVQGFLTASGKFVDRTEGMCIAIAAGQVVKEGNEGTVLFSEDLY